jgi:CAAX protease family protein
VVAARMSPLLRGQLLLFDKPEAPTYTPQQSLRLLWIFLVLEVIVRPLLFAASAKWVPLRFHDSWSLVQLTVLTVLACWLTITFAGVPLIQLGLRSWSRWSQTEKVYLIEIVPIATLVFSLFVFADLKALWIHPTLWKLGLLVFAQKMVWGFYQELLYRGVLQTDLVRRWGVKVGILVSNLLYTLGPLHAYHFVSGLRYPPHLWIFAAIFSIGLFFAVIYQRSGNLWIVGVMHGIGDWFIDGLSQVTRLM